MRAHGSSWYGIALFGAWSALAAQPSMESAIEAAAADARRYADCIAEGDIECLFGLTHWELLDEFGGRARRSQRNFLERYAEEPGPDGSAQRLLYAEPWEPVMSGDRLVTIVPAAYMAAHATIDLWMGAGTYLLGVSEDSGATWRFVGGNLVSRGDVERLVPELRGKLPSTDFAAIIAPPPLFETQYLRTTDAFFVLGDAAASYALRFRVTKRLTDEIALVISFDDPENPARPRFIQTRLMPGQRTLEIASPTMTEFEAGEIYNVVVHGSNPITGEEIFEHTQPVLYSPDYETEQRLRQAGTGESF